MKKIGQFSRGSLDEVHKLIKELSDQDIGISIQFVSVEDHSRAWIVTIWDSPENWSEKTFHKFEDCDKHIHTEGNVQPADIWIGLVKNLL